MTHYYALSYMDSQETLNYSLGCYITYADFCRRFLLLIVTLSIVLPFLAAALIPFIYRRFTSIHLGWFVLIVPVVLFSYLATYIPRIASGETFIKTFEWIPSYGINITTYLDGLSMIFSLLITGVGSLVILYSIFYLSTKESLHHFYCYLLLSHHNLGAWL